MSKAVQCYNDWRRGRTMAEFSVSSAAQAVTSPLRMTYEEYQAWAPEIHAEWKNGEVILFMPPKKYHQRVVEFLHTLLALFVEALDLGRIGIAPFEVKLSPDGSAREPDLFFVATPALDRWTTDRFIGGPDLVVEVISTDSVGRDRGDKFYEYQDAGVREYWIIDPRPGRERVDCYMRDADGHFQPLVPDDQGILRSVILSGLTLRLEWLWQDPPPPALMILLELSRADTQLADALRHMLGTEPG